MSVLKSLPMTRGIFFVVFVLGGVSAQNHLKLSHPSESESQEEIEKLLREIELLLDSKMKSKVQEFEVEDHEEDRGNDVAANTKTCNCSGYKCSCCQIIRISIRPQIGCLYVTFVPRTSTILASLTLGSIRIFSGRVVPVSRYLPQPICVRAPKRISRWGTVCVQFTGFTYWPGNTLYGCSKFNFRASGRVTNVDFGCFTLKVRSDIQHGIADEEEELQYLKTSAKDPESIHA